MNGKTKRTPWLARQAALILILLNLLIDGSDGVAKCHKCDGINCLRTSYTGTENCEDTFDSCVTIFEGSTVLAQGCYGQLAVELRSKCDATMTNMEDDELTEDDEAPKYINKECYQCSEDMCNNVSGDGFECIQCDSNFDMNCASKIENSHLKKCPISRSLNSYCFAKLEGSHVIRGCAPNLIQQRECLNDKNCELCSPLDISGCNRELKGSAGGSGGGGGGSGGSGGGGSTGGGGSGGAGGGGSSGGSGGGGSTGGGGSGGAGGGGSSGGSGGGGSTGGGGSGGSAGGGSTGGGGSGGSGGGGSSGGSGSGGSTGGGGSGGSGGGGGAGGSGGGGSEGGNNSSSSAHFLSNYRLLTTFAFILVGNFLF